MAEYHISSSEFEASSIPSSDDGTKALAPTSEIEELISKINREIDYLFEDLRFIRTYAPPPHALFTQADEYGHTPLSVAAAKERKAEAGMLLKGNVDVNSKNKLVMTPLSQAADNGREMVVRLLLRHQDMDLNSRDRNDFFTPLSWASAAERGAILSLLLQRDDVWAHFKTTNGQTPLSCAAELGDVEVAQMLLQRDDIEADSKDKYRRTPLNWAADKGHESIVQLLVSRKDVEVNSEDRDCFTPLARASDSGHETVVRLLLERVDVKVNLQGIYGLTALAQASRGGHEAVVRLLLSGMILRSIFTM